MKFDTSTYRMTDPGKLGTIALVIGVIALAASAAGYAIDSKQFFASYLTSFVFWVSIGLGGLFFTMVHHMVGANWSVVIRRILESTGYALPLMFVFFIPLIFGLNELYRWSIEEQVATDHLLQHKEPYLNTPFFIIRNVIYFAVWSFLAHRLYRLSVKQDDQSTPEITSSFKKASAPGLILFAVTITLASFDWMMSLDAHWFSTIYGAYFFSGSAMAMMAFAQIFVVHMRRNKILNDTITVEHDHDIAKLAFAFIVFWAYMAFSQYMLIWYANIPEETIWYEHRWIGSWKTVSLVLIIGHFVVPFLILITRQAKRMPALMYLGGFWLLIMHYIDIYWNVMPNFAHHGAHFSWMDVSTLVGIGGVFVWYFWKIYTAKALVPVNDPRLDASIEFVNHY